MNFRTRHLLSWLVAATVTTLSGTTQAVPKAAEQEDAPVTVGANVARPKLSAKVAKPAKPQVAKKARATSKGKATRNTRTAKNTAKRK